METMRPTRNLLRRWQNFKHVKYSVILFDCDGVVVKSKRLFSEQLQLDYGIDSQKLQPFFKGIFRECSRGNADLKAELAKVVGNWGWSGTVDELLTYWFKVGTECDDEVLGYISDLRRQGVRCFMATDQERYRGEYLRRTLGSGKPFEEIFFSAEIGHLKKESEFWDTVRGRFDTMSPQQIVFVDDEEENLRRAKDLGFATYLFKELDQLRQFLPIYQWQ